LLDNSLFKKNIWLLVLRGLYFVINLGDVSCILLAWQIHLFYNTKHLLTMIKSSVVPKFLDSFIHVHFAGHLMHLICESLILHLPLAFISFHLLTFVRFVIFRSLSVRFEILGSQNSEDVDGSLLGCDIMWTCTWVSCFVGTYWLHLQDSGQILLSYCDNGSKYILLMATNLARSTYGLPHP
jgi:hypothetical protein